MRKLAALLLVGYAALTGYLLLRAMLGLPFLLPLAYSLPLVAFTIAVLHAGVRLGWRRALLLLGLTFGVSLLFESLGVAAGWVFGAYRYTDRLGPRFFGLVPYIIPLSWFMMTYPSYIIAERVVPNRWSPALMRRLAVAGVGGLVMTSWDLVLDPLMVSRRHWVWETPGSYFGVPVQNYLGWWLTTLIILALFIWLSRTGPLPAGPDVDRFDRLAVLSYAVTGMSSLIDALQAGLVGPAVAGFLGMAPWVLLAWWMTRSTRTEDDFDRQEIEKSISGGDFHR